MAVADAPSTISPFGSITRPLKLAEARVCCARARNVAELCGASARQRETAPERQARKNQRFGKGAIIVSNDEFGKLRLYDRETAYERICIMCEAKAVDAISGFKFS